MSIKKKLAGAVLAGGIGVAAISGGTFALFTSNATNNANTFASGTVVITDTTGSGNVFQGKAYVSNLAPGDAEQGSITVRNDGTLDEWVKIESATGAGDLFSGANPVVITPENSVVKLAPGETKTFTVDYSFPAAAGNEYQDKDGTVTVKVDAVQARNNTNAAEDGPTSWQ